MIVEIRVLGKIADAPFDAQIADRAAEDLGAAVGWKHELYQQLERGRLAGAVRAEEAEHLAGPDLEREAVERPIGALAPESDRVVLR